MEKKSLQYCGHMSWPCNGKKSLCTFELVIGYNVYTFSTSTFHDYKRQLLMICFRTQACYYCILRKIRSAHASSISCRLLLSLSPKFLDLSNGGYQTAFLGTGRPPLEEVLEARKNKVWYKNYYYLWMHFCRSITHLVIKKFMSSFGDYGQFARSA